MRAELMRYRTDKLSSLLNLLGLFLNVIYLIVLYSAPSIPATDKLGFFLGLDTIYHILFMLVTFYVSEKVKAYAHNWCFVGGAFGLLQLPRIILPIAFSSAGQLNKGRLIFCILLLICSAIAMLVACYTSYVKTKKLSDYLKELNSEVT